MFRVVPKLRSTIRDLTDSIRFMSKSDRRRVYYGTAVVTSLTSTGLYLGYHSVYNDSVMEFLQMYRHKFGIPVNLQLRSLLEATLEEMEIETQNNASIGLFNFVGNEIYSIGTLKLPTGAYIGVPFNMNFTDESQLKVEDIRLLGRYRTKRSTNAPIIKKLFEAMILSDQAKKYALAHELQQLSSSYLIVKSLNIFCCTLGSFLLAPILSNKLGFTQKKRLPRIFSGLMCFLTVTVLAGAVIDQLLDEWYDLLALKRVLRNAKSNSEFKTGAVEYYRKLIDRNRALFELLGEYGPQYYSEDGQTKRLFGLMKQSYEGHLILASNSFNSV